MMITNFGSFAITQCQYRQLTIINKDQLAKYGIRHRRFSIGTIKWVVLMIMVPQYSVCHNQSSKHRGAIRKVISSKESLHNNFPICKAATEVLKYANNKFPFVRTLIYDKNFDKFG
jgi:hypothetical protein